MMDSAGHSKAYDECFHGRQIALGGFCANLAQNFLDGWLSYNLDVIISK